MESEITQRLKSGIRNPGWRSLESRTLLDSSTRKPLRTIIFILTLFLSRVLTLDLHSIYPWSGAVCILPSVFILPPVSNLQFVFYTERQPDSGIYSKISLQCRRNSENSLSVFTAEKRVSFLPLSLSLSEG